MLSALSTMVGTALLEAFTSPCSKNISLGTAAEIAPPIVRAGSSSDIATICLDQSLRIKWFAPATQRTFNFISGDIGRPVSDIASAIGDSDLVTAARAVVVVGPPKAPHLPGLRFEGIDDVFD